MAEVLYKYVYLDLAGFPLILRSDNGSEFTAELTRELNQLIGIEQVFSSPYHPQSLGLLEGSHNPLEEILQAYVEEYPSNWASQLPIVRWAWNTSRKEPLGNMSPYQVITGMVPRSPLAKLAETPEQRPGDASGVCHRVAPSYESDL